MAEMVTPKKTGWATAGGFRRRKRVDGFYFSPFISNTPVFSKTQMCCHKTQLSSSTQHDV